MTIRFPNLPFPEYIEATRKSDGTYRFILVLKHLNCGGVTDSKESRYVNLKVSEMPDNLRSSVNLLRMRLNDSHLEGLGCISDNWICVRIDKDELQQLKALSTTGHAGPSTISPLQSKLI
jgi:hypothetical protein